MFAKGLLYVISGPMFAGKTSELIRLYDRSVFGNMKSVLIKPKMDNRYSESDIITHDNRLRKSYNISNVEELNDILALEKPDNIFIDEAQFFASNIVEKIDSVRKQGINVYVSLLNQTSEGKAFPFMDKILDIGTLLANADYIETFTAVCPICGKNATKSYKLEASGNEVDIGGKNKYEPRCFEHWEPRK